MRKSDDQYTELGTGLVDILQGIANTGTDFVHGARGSEHKCRRKRRAQHGRIGGGCKRETGMYPQFPLFYRVYNGFFGSPSIFTSLPWLVVKFQTVR